MSKGDQLKVERRAPRYPDSPISFSQLFSLPIEKQAPRSRHRYSNWLFFTIIFIANFNASLLCQTEKVGEQKNVQGGLAQVVERSIRIREAPGSIPGFSNQFFFTIIFVANCNTSFLCQTEKVGEQKICPRGLAPVVERSIRIREAPGSIPGFSNQFFFTIIFVANCNTSFL